MYKLQTVEYILSALLGNGVFLRPRQASLTHTTTVSNTKTPSLIFLNYISPYLSKYFPTYSKQQTTRKCFLFSPDPWSQLINLASRTVLVKHNNQLYLVIAS